MLSSTAEWSGTAGNGGGFCPPSSTGFSWQTLQTNLPEWLLGIAGAARVGTVVAVAPGGLVVMVLG